MTHTILSIMSARPQAPACSICGDQVPCGSDAIACVCSPCTHAMASRPKESLPQQAGPACRECGQPVVGIRRFCHACAKRRQRERARNYARQYRREAQ